MEPIASPADLARLAETFRAEGYVASVEAEASRIRLPGNCYARPKGDGEILGWAESPDVLWYGRFRSVGDLARSARRIRCLRWVARAGLGLLGLWLAHATLTASLPGYLPYVEDLELVQEGLALCLFFGAFMWLSARVFRWRMALGDAGVVWVRSPWQRI